MNRFDGQNVSRTSSHKKGAIIGSALALLVIIAGASAFLVFRSASMPAQEPQAVRSIADAAPRSDEIPYASQRARSTTAVSPPTTMMPWAIAFDYVHGFVWVAEPGCEPTPKCSSTFPGIIGQYALSDGSFIQDFKEPAGYSSPLFLALDSNGNIWFTQPSSDALGEFTPQTGTWNQWSLKKGSAPFDLTFDTYGNLWFTEFAGNNIGFFNTQTHALVENSIPTADSNPYGITIAPNGTVWFAENRDSLGQIGSFTPTASGIVKITEHAVIAARPHLMRADKAGNIWYSNGFAGNIGEFDPRSGSSKTFHVYFGTCTPASCTGTHISGLAVDAKGHIWFTDSLSQRVGYLVPSTGQVVAQTLKTNNAHPNDGLTIDSSGRIWFTEEFVRAISMWPAGAV